MCQEINQKLLKNYVSIPICSSPISRAFVTIWNYLIKVCVSLLLYILKLTLRVINHFLSYVEKLRQNNM